MAGAAQFLQELPSQGYFSSSQPSSNPGGLRVYICDHETAPPEDQLIKTDATNILIRYLTLKKGKVEHKGGSRRKIDDGKGKRPADRSSDDKVVTKRANVGGGSGTSRREAGSGRLSDKELQSFNVPKIKSLLKERGQPVKGNKDELIARLKKAIVLYT